MIRACRREDASAIASIYNHYVQETVVSFESEPVTPDQMAARITRITEKHPWLVVEQASQIVGFAYATLWQERIAYRHSWVTTVYLAPGYERQGHGRRLYEALFDALKGSECRILVAGIALPNAGSVGLHERLGFTKVAHFKDVGRKHGEWIDVGYWQKTINTEKSFP